MWASCRPRTPTARRRRRRRRIPGPGAAAYPASYRHEAFGGYAASLPVQLLLQLQRRASEEKEHAQAQHADRLAAGHLPEQQR